MMYLSYTAPHTPNQGKSDDLKLFEGTLRQTYAAMLYALDRGIGEVVEELKRTGKYENTIIFFLSDNGGATSNGAGNLPLKGFKGNKFEGGHRVPFIVTWGARLKGEKPFKGLTSSLDVFATIVDVVGIEEEKLKNPLDGVSLIPYLTESKEGDPHKILYWRKMDSRSIRKEDYKLTLTKGIDTVMYNLADDLDEMKNLLEKKPGKAKELIKKLAEWEEKECIEPMWVEDGWADRTNGIHHQLMNNEIKTADDFNNKRKKK